MRISVARVGKGWVALPMQEEITLDGAEMLLLADLVGIEGTLGKKVAKLIVRDIFGEREMTRDEFTDEYLKGGEEE